MTPREMGRVLDYPEEQLQEIRENQLHLLTMKEKISRKVIYSALFSITKMDLSCNIVEYSKNHDSNPVKVQNLNDLNPGFNLCEISYLTQLAYDHPMLNS